MQPHTSQVSLAATTPGEISSAIEETIIAEAAPEAEEYQAPHAYSHTEPMYSYEHRNNWRNELATGTRASDATLEHAQMARANQKLRAYRDMLLSNPDLMPPRIPRPPRNVSRSMGNEQYVAAIRAQFAPQPTSPSSPEQAQQADPSIPTSNNVGRPSNPGQFPLPDSVVSRIPTTPSVFPIPGSQLLAAADPRVCSTCGTTGSAVRPLCPVLNIVLCNRCYLANIRQSSLPSYYDMMEGTWAVTWKQ